ncbi:snapalysin family zinc-dependent metalloprotease [Microbispora sp. NPDC004025]
MSPMRVSRFLRAVAALLTGAAVLLTVSPARAAQPAGGTTASTTASMTASMTASAAVRVLRYDASRAAEFHAVMDQAAQVWNASVTSVRLVAGTPADFVVLADNGWPRTSVTRLGRGTIWMGREATAEGYHPLRIATHEIGHILGLPDRRTGRCTDLMSGHSAPVSCTNATPSAAERSAVEANFAGSALRAGDLAGGLFVDRPDAARDPVPAP